MSFLSSTTAQPLREHILVVNEEKRGLIPMSRRSPGEENDNPLQYSCLENSIDRGAWRATVQGVAKSQKGLSD